MKAVSIKKALRNLDFNKTVDRSGTHSIKWDYREKLFGKHDILPMWVADMDFESPPAVKEALQARVTHGIFGYTGESKEYFRGIMNWLERRHHFVIAKEWLQYVPGVIPGLSFAIQAFTHPGDNVIVQPPVYKPFFTSVKRNLRHVMENPLKFDGSRYTMDLDDLKSKIDENTKLLILCSPHNPVGRVWDREELENLGAICLENNILIISDEIHFDMVYTGKKHIPIATLSPAIQARTITLSSPGKTFNLQGLQSAYAVIPDEGLRKKFRQKVEQSGIFLNNALSITAVEAAYNKGEEWLEALLQYLEQNKEFLKNYVDDRLPGIEMCEPEGTYLGWLDCKALNMEQEELNKFMVQKAGIALNDGSEFGKEGRGHMRINFGCPREILELGLSRLKTALEDMKF